MSADSSSPGSSSLAPEAFGASNVGTAILAILDALPFYVMLVDEQHHILLANRAVRDALGVEPHEILGGFCPQVVHGQDEPFAGCPLEEALASGRDAVCEHVDEKTGRWLEAAIYPTRQQSATGHRIYFHLVRDVTARKKAEQERNALAVELETALAQVLSGFIPICAVCKRIRDESGDWTTVEEYVASRTAAEFSHGLCPTCVRDHYGRPTQGSSTA